MYYKCKTDILPGFEKGCYYRISNETDTHVSIINENNVPCIYRKIDLEKYFIKKKIENIKSSESRVNHPTHYTWLKDKCGIEVIDITRHLNFNLGNALKYILRAGHKTEEGYSSKDKLIEDLNKAVWYINDYIKTLNNGN